MLLSKACVLHSVLLHIWTPVQAVLPLAPFPAPETHIFPPHFLGQTLNLILLCFQVAFSSACLLTCLFSRWTAESFFVTLQNSSGVLMKITFHLQINWEEFGIFTAFMPPIQEHILHVPSRFPIPLYVSRWNFVVFFLQVQHVSY